MAFGALGVPLGNIETAFRPDEPDADAVQCLVQAKVSGGGRGVVEGEDGPSK